jgi:hypothetical protein
MVLTHAFSLRLGGMGRRTEKEKRRNELQRFPSSGTG